MSSELLFLLAVFAGIQKVYIEKGAIKDFFNFRLFLKNILSSSAFIDQFMLLTPTFFLYVAFLINPQVY